MNQMERARLELRRDEYLSLLLEYELIVNRLERERKVSGSENLPYRRENVRDVARLQYLQEEITTHECFDREKFNLATMKAGVLEMKMVVEEGVLSPEEPEGKPKVRRRIELD